jgi:hypothetical protein
MREGSTYNLTVDCGGAFSDHVRLHPRVQSAGGHGSTRETTTHLGKAERRAWVGCGAHAQADETRCLVILVQFMPVNCKDT